MLNVFLIIVGMVMEIFTAIVVAVPLVLPLAAAYGLDPFHFAIIFLLNLEIAYLAPPLGINLFISSIRFAKPVTYLYRAVLVFIGVLFLTLMLVCYVPIIVTWLPSKLHIDERHQRGDGARRADADGLLLDLNDLNDGKKDGGTDAGSDAGAKDKEADAKDEKAGAAGAGAAAAGAAAEKPAKAAKPPGAKKTAKP